MNIDLDEWRLKKDREDLRLLGYAETSLIGIILGLFLLLAFLN